MKSTVRVLAIAILVAPLLFSESFGGELRKMMQASGMTNRPKMLQTRIAAKHVLLDPLPAGSYTIGVGGYFPTIDSAYKRLEVGGIGGPVTLLLTDTLYVAPFPPGDFRLIGPIAGAGPASRITVRPADNVAVRIEGSGYATLTFEDVSYLTLDGITLKGSTRLKVHTSINTFYDWNDAIDLWGDCKYDMVQNLTAGSDRIDLQTSTILLASKDSTTVDSCIVSGVSITSGGNGIYVFGYKSFNRPKGNVIRGNHVGSPNDSLISQGIMIVAADGTIVEENHVEHLVENLTGGVGDWPSVTGINSYYCSNTIIRCNVVRGLRGTAGGGLYGIIVSGDSSKIGQGVQVYNNMVYDLENRSTTTDGYISGILLWYNSDALIAYNTVTLSGTSADPAGSDALALAEAITNATIRNNILVNTYHITNATGGGSTALWWAQGMSMASDHNDLFVDTTFTNSALVYQWNVGGYRTLSQWQGTGYDAYSLSVLPVFAAPFLHLDSTSSISRQLDGRGIPIAGITTDFDGQLRSGSSPDIGADETDFTVGVEAHHEGVPLAFALEQNYPNPFNPTTVVSYQLSVASNVKLVVFDILGREVAVLVNEKKAPGSYDVKFDASALASGVYLYRLTAGSFVQTRKMLVVK